jgi:hypothetical protein
MLSRPLCSEALTGWKAEHRRHKAHLCLAPTARNRRRCRLAGTAGACVRIIYYEREAHDTDPANPTSRMLLDVLAAAALEGTRRTRERTIGAAESARSPATGSPRDRTRTRLRVCLPSDEVAG